MAPDLRRSKAAMTRTHKDAIQRVYGGLNLRRLAEEYPPTHSVSPPLPVSVLQVRMCDTLA